jgi:enamine deaminase RidA (YjgF/YER057c/UK114 family)
MSVYEQMQRLQLQLPDLPPTHQFLRTNIVSDLVFISGHAPFEGGEFRYRGTIGKDLDLLVGQRAAASAVLGCLASFEHEVGPLDTIRQIAKLNGYVNCAEDFQDLPRVTDAASDLLINIFGNSGRHARTTVGVMSLPMGVAVEIELIVRISTPA